MGRAKTQAKRRGGRRSASEKGKAKGTPAGVTKASGLDKFGPVGGPKGPSDPTARSVGWPKQS